MLGPLLAACAADAVAPCPPMFRPSHRGCQLAPTTTEIVVGCVLFFVVMAVLVAIAVGRKKDDGG